MLGLSLENVRLLRFGKELIIMTDNNDFPSKPNKKPIRKWWYLAGIILIAVAVLGCAYFYRENTKTVEIPLSEAIVLSKDKVFSEMQVGDVVTLVVAEDLNQRASTNIEGESIILKGKQKVEVGLMGYSMKDLKELGFVMPPVYKEVQSSWWDSLVKSPFFSTVVSLLVLLGLFMLFMKTDIFAGKAGSLFKLSDKSISFADVGGLGDVKDSLMESVSFLRDRKFLEKMGANIPHGILLNGAPGVGKTMLARAMATEANVPFYFCSASEFHSKWVGMAGDRIKKLFKQAKKTPSIIFIDEIDSVGQTRSFGGSDVSREFDHTLNQLLAEMDGFDKSSQVLVIAATNHAEVLDQALLRQGRFDRQINIPLPNFKERIEILDIHSKDKPLSNDVNLESISKSTSGMSGADLAGIWNEASIIAGREHKDAIDMQDINKALDRILAGCERKGTVFTEKEKRIVAYHEAGHALVASLLPECDKVQRVSILPHGESGGFTRLSSENEERLISKSKAKAMISMILGGRVAEELVIGDVSNGAQNDLQKANQIAREMVEKWGMGESFGMRFSSKVSGFSVLSQKTQDTIDGDVESLLKDCYDHAKDLIEGKMAVLKTLTDRLIEVEVVDAEEVERIIGEN
jgi:cell division protease FtsH